MGKSLVPKRVAHYAGAGFILESDVLRATREETAALPSASMLLGVDTAGYLAWLTRLINARRVLELGTFTGYSSLAIAQAMPNDGRLVTCDMSKEWTAMARRHWKAAGVAHKISLRLGPALRTLDSLLKARRHRTFDFAFIDADKREYDGYYERCLKLVRPGGIIAFDNALWAGAVAKRGAHDPITACLHALNQKVRTDPRVDACLLTVGDGLLLARPKPRP